MLNKYDFRIAAIFLVLYSLLSIVAYSILGGVFDFPEILRKPISDRFSLFNLHKDIIIPTYYFFSLTGILQILFSIYLFQITNNRDTNNIVALFFGVLAGLAQTLGFIRWVVAIPYLTTLSLSADVSNLEGIFNAYFGMSVGEHLGSLFLGIWLIYFSCSIRKSYIFDKKLSIIALISGILMLPVAFEPLNEIFSLFAILSIPVYGLVITWMLLIAYSLIKFNGSIVNINLTIWVIALIFWVINIIPAFL